MYKCDKCGGVVYSYRNRRYYYRHNKYQIALHCVPCYCSHCKKYTAAQVGLKRRHINAALQDLLKKHSFFSRFFNREVARGIKLCKCLQKFNKHWGDTAASCVICGNANVVIVEDLQGMPHSMECDGLLQYVPQEEREINFFSPRPEKLLPRPSVTLRYPEKAQNQILEKDVLKYFELVSYG